MGVSRQFGETADGDGPHNRGLIVLFVVIICSPLAMGGRPSLSRRPFCGRMQSCSNY
jgi:hypothetical protein